MTKLHFNYKDIFRAFRLGFSAKKIWVGFVGLLFGWLGYALLGYIAYLVSGATLVNVWNSFRLVPVPAVWCFTFNWAGWLLWAVGVAWLGIVSMIAGITISKLTYEQLRGDEFFEVKEAWKQGIKSAGSLVATPLLLILTIAFLVGAGFLLGAIGMIPYAGPILVGLLAIPAFAVTLCIIYLGIVFAFTFSIGPSIIGATRCDAFDNLFEVFSCVNDQPWRLIWYQFLLVIFSVVGMLILLVFSVLAMRLGTAIVGFITGENLFVMINASAETIKVGLPYWAQWIVNFTGLPALIAPIEATGNWATTVGSVLFSVAYHAIILFVMGYGMAIWYSGNTVVYLVLVKKKDDRNLLEIVDEELEIPEKLDVTATPEPVKPAKKTSAKKAPAKKKPAKKPAAKKTAAKKKTTTRKRK